MSCSCVDGTPCPVELELLEKVEAAHALWENFRNPGAEAAVEQAERPLYEHRKDVQHYLCGQLAHAEQELRTKVKDYPRAEAQKRLESIQERYAAAKAATCEVAGWTRAERLQIGGRVI